MKCPVCDAEMQKGGIIAFDTADVRWLPLADYEADPAELSTENGYSLGAFEYRPLGWRSRDMVRLDDAWFCEDCFKVVGVFNISP